MTKPTKPPFISTKITAKAAENAEKPLIEDEFSTEASENDEESEENEAKLDQAIASARGEKPRGAKEVSQGK